MIKRIVKSYLFDVSLKRADALKCVESPARSRNSFCNTFLVWVQTFYFFFRIMWTKSGGCPNEMTILYFVDHY